MRYLKTQGTPIEVNEKIYYIKYTLDVIDELQDRLNMPMAKLLMCLTGKRNQRDAIKRLLKHLIGVEIEPIELEYYSTVLINAYIEQIRYKDMPEPQKSDDDIPFINVEYWFYVGKIILGFPSDEVWNMTIGQIRTLKHMYDIVNKHDSEDVEQEKKKENILAF